ncbi:hypothetical protein MNB_SV-12-1608 [hydrothermal vent metagenome]|uniref:Uncharacterized protein n=1 Tax=hydrothermal vent metagenome TaxID=652676 RepID=A0A1W1BGC7_9ZZZZ
MIKIDKITLNNFRFFIDENEHKEGFEIPFVKKSNSLIESLEKLEVEL